MKLARIKDDKQVLQIVASVNGQDWFKLSDIQPEKTTADIVDIMAQEKREQGCFKRDVEKIGSKISPTELTPDSVLPLQPKAYRDFMLYEEHAINAARGFVKKYLPKLKPVVGIYEKVTGKTFPKLKPHKRYYQYPIYYLGNHLNFVTNGAQVEIPQYTKELDYELEIGVITCKPLKNATPEEAEGAIGGFVVFNDFSARDVQISEIRCGFGPMKSKNFINAISREIVTADEVGDSINNLNVSVSINGAIIAQNTTGGMYHSLAEAIAYASWEEQLYPGELFGSGTIPQCTGIENGHFLKKGDTIRLEIEKIGYLENTVI